MVSQLFSLARSPEAPGPRVGFWFGSQNSSGEVSLFGGYAPTTPGAASEFGAKGAPRSPASRVVDSCPSVHPMPVKAGHGLLFVLVTGTLTGSTSARPNGPPHPLFGGAA